MNAAVVADDSEVYIATRMRLACTSEMSATSTPSTPCNNPRADSTHIRNISGISVPQTELELLLVRFDNVFHADQHSLTKIILFCLQILQLVVKLVPDKSTTDR
jgi:hypothetical protein